MIALFDGGGSEQGELIGIGVRGAGGTTGEEAVGGDEQIELAGMALDPLGKAGGGEELVEGIADVFQLAVKVIAVAVEPVLEALEQVGREVRAVDRGVAVRGDSLQARGLTPRQSRFVELVVSGASNADAYRCAYRKPVGRLSNRDAANGAYRVAKTPAVQARLAELRSRSERTELLTINARLSLLAKIARDRHGKPMDRLRSIAIYTRIAGDGAPGRVETCGPVGSLAVSELQGENLGMEEKIERLQAAKRADQGTTTATREPTKMEKIAAMAAARKARVAAEGGLGGERAQASAPQIPLAIPGHQLPYP